jgi:hypothetical protein
VNRRLWQYDIPVRVFAAAIIALVILGGVVLGAAARERSALPDAARGLLRATLSASVLSGCLEGVQDDTHGRRDTSRAAVERALTRLSTCDVARVERDLAAVDLPPAPPLIDADRRKARANVEQGIALIHAAALDARGAKRAMREDLTTRPNALAVTLAFRSAFDASNRAFDLAYEALSLLHQPQSINPRSSPG